jgi:hypothetical protein
MNNNRGYSYHKYNNKSITKVNKPKYSGQSLPKLVKKDKTNKSQVKLPIIKNNHNNNDRNLSLINNHKKYEQNLFRNMGINKKSTDTNTNIRKYINSFSEPRLPIEFNDLSYDNMKE